MTDIEKQAEELAATLNAECASQEEAQELIAKALKTAEQRGADMKQLQANNTRTPQVTDEMVERAALALMEAFDGDAGRYLITSASLAKSIADDVLAAALLVLYKQH